LEQKILLDFHGASHGHFLEYLINTWIFDGHRVDKIFTDLGTSHGAQKDSLYRKSKKIHCDHYTEYNNAHETPCKIIRISVDTISARLIHMINVMYRIGDIGLEKSYSLLPVEVQNNPAKLRNEWFSKLSDTDHGYNLDLQWRWTDRPAFFFPMENLYACVDLYRTMQDCAKFLDLKFSPDKELYQIWQQFIEGNQGLRAYKNSKIIVDRVMGQIDYDFEASIPEQALINLLLTQTVGLFDGPLFDQDSYPCNTLEIWKYVDHHLTTFDRRFR